MFSNDAQRAQVCMTLLGSLGLKGLWTEKGPTEKAVKYRFQSPLSHGENIILRVCWTLWTSDDGTPAPFGEIVWTLDPTRLEMVGSLIEAAADGSEGVGAWLIRWGPAGRHPQ